MKHDHDGTVEQAIREGILNGHGLPFTPHTETMNPPLFQYGLDISHRLDERFGCKTVAAQMTDVPGHTIGIVPAMSKAGIKLLHIGINPATPVPTVPPLFRWKCGEEEVVVMYQGEYGDLMDFGDFSVCFAHTGDNQGPQSKVEKPWLRILYGVHPTTSYTSTASEKKQVWETYQTELEAVQRKSFIDYLQRNKMVQELDKAAAEYRKRRAVERAVEAQFAQAAAPL